MGLFAGTMGQLIIVELFVLIIWIKVFTVSVKSRNPSLSYRRLLLTSIGLVLNAISITAIISFRLYEYVQGLVPFIWGLTVFYAVLALGNFMFIVSASLGTDGKMLKWFLVASAVWSSLVFFLITTGIGVPLW